MSCERWEPLYTSFLDGELSTSDEQEMRDHLESCSSCRAEIESLRPLSEVLSVSAEPDPGFIVRFRARRDQELGPMDPWVLWKWLAVRLLPVALGALLGAGAAVWLSQEEAGLGELEARELGNGLSRVSEEAALMDPVLSIALEPFPGTEP